MANWLFIVKDHIHGGIRIPAWDILRNSVEHRFWSLNSRARNIKRLQPGDNVIFCVSSSEGRLFAGHARIASKAHPITPAQKFNIVGKPSENFDYSIELEDAEIWQKSLPAEELLEQLSFIKNKQRWPSAFRGSIRELNDDDYNMIINLAKMRS
ncbi:MAG: EVE domain-containing protein [Aigarchaeota archaeon]|nr:EVE domain-containing protein [Candidatus Pelearchaeum maunauluense]